ncbi:hypothetical protein AZ78_0657 [Lysobacter capsici AZ78]|uniref:Knr4/Smi1-like domain-containing protein n=1 Tax=Lysobacter capsici AZ78 TaxID=1444315 RepID=A0A125MME1_9GAMM|nr:hypothetical protein [Lysobacter capsici]KWS03111.1 hypothetical protein AZ78_0657 [Lysobacter capsici AZ78]
MARSYESLRPLLQPWGELRSQPASQWQGDIALPPTLEAFYRELGPWGETVHESVGPIGLSLDAGGNPVDIPPLHKLWSLQAGYRWHGLSGERLPAWKDEWLTVAMEGGNPFILDMRSGAVLFDLVGGPWSPRPIADDLATAFGAIATVANAYTALGEEALDEDDDLRPQARAQVRDTLADFLDGDRRGADALLAAWRWYE